MITRLELSDWKSHSSSVLTFKKGTNILLGRMGSGKSSVLDALCFALYGTFPKLSRRDQSTETIVNIGSSQLHATVRLDFEKKGKKYTVWRKIGKKTSEAELRIEGKLLQKGPKAVTDYITEILGVDYELFTRAIYSEQNRIDYLLSLTPGARKQEIDWLLGLGKFDEAREAAITAAGKLHEHSQLLYSEANPMKTSASQKKIDDLEKQIGEKKSAYEKLCKEAGDLSAVLSEKESALAFLERKKAEWRLKKSECDLQKGACERLQKETEGKQKPQKEALAALTHSRTEHEENLRAERLLAKKIQSSLSGIKSEMAVLQSSIKLADEKEKAKKRLEEKMKSISSGKTAAEMENEISALKKEVESLSQKQAKAKAEIAELSEAVEKLAGRDGKCPVCDSELPASKSNELSEGKKQQIEEKKAHLQKHTKELLEKNAALSSLEKNLSEMKLFSAEAERISKEAIDKALLQKELDEKLLAKKQLDEEYEKCENRLSSLEKKVEAARREEEETQRTEKLFADLEDAQKRLDNAQQHLAKLDFDEEKYEVQRKSAELLRIDYTKAQSQLGSEEKQLSLMEEMLSVLQKELSEMRKKEALAKKYSEAAESLAIYKNSLIYAQSELRRLLVEEINEALFEIWPAIYPYSDYTGVKLEADEKDYRLLMDKGGWKEVDTVASGGERACFCLALRIAFATVLTPDIGWLILDEPTHNLDEEAVLMLSEAINKKIPSIVEQTFVITHDSALGESGQGNVFKLERDKAKGEPTKIIKHS